MIDPEKVISVQTPVRLDRAGQCGLCAMVVLLIWTLSAIAQPAPTQTATPAPSGSGGAAVGFVVAAGAAATNPAPSPDGPAAFEAAAPVPAAAAQAATPPATLALMPQDLSLSAMFLHADIVVRIVMVGLASASVVTWTVLLAKGTELILARRAIGAALARAEAHETLAELMLRTRGLGDPATPMTAAADREMRLSGDMPRAGTKERIASRLRRVEAQLCRRMARGTGWLATIGATAPFIGLFGTVWGIMNSFIGISQSHTTNLAVVAPGIAEALLATAAGLVAAIPAVVIYNAFARGIAAYRAAVADLAASVERLASRDVDANRAPLKAAAE